MNIKKNLPVAITLGEPGGIGPRIIFESCRDLIRDGKCFYFLIADFAKVQPIAERYNCPIEKIILDDWHHCNWKALPIYDIPFEKDITPGQINSDNANSVLRMIETAVALIHDRKACAMVTGPINKKAISKGIGRDFNGHTDFLASLHKDQPKPIMLMQSEKFRVVPLTSHIPLRSVPYFISKKNIKETVKIVNRSLKDLWKIPNPRIFISGLNPHAGEMGTLGNEELAIIEPAINELTKEKINAFGPYPADSLFNSEMRSSFDVAICMYHDQALIPIKSLFFETAVNITLGLPIIRTSPAHGTAAELIDAEKVSTTSFKNSLIEAHRLATIKSTILEGP